MNIDEQFFLLNLYSINAIDQNHRSCLLTFYFSKSLSEKDIYTQAWKNLGQDENEPSLYVLNRKIYTDTKVVILQWKMVSMLKKHIDFIFLLLLTFYFYLSSFMALHIHCYINYIFLYLRKHFFSQVHAIIHFVEFFSILILNSHGFMKNYLYFVLLHEIFSNIFFF